jgi:Predicted membrane protein
MVVLGKSIHPSSATAVPESPVAKFLFDDTRMAWFWLIVRLYVGYEWVTAGWEKVTGGWVSGSTVGTGIKGFLMGALAKSSGAHAAVQPWYAWFIQHVALPAAPFFSYLVAFGELLVGVGLIVGCLTGIAAFFGLLMNVNYLFAGTVSTNPQLAVLGLLLVLAWRIAGFYGLDSVVLPYLGTSWTGSLADKKDTGKKVKEPASIS